MTGQKTGLKYNRSNQGDEVQVEWGRETPQVRVTKNPWNREVAAGHWREGMVTEEMQCRCVQCRAKDTTRTQKTHKMPTKANKMTGSWTLVRPPYLRLKNAGDNPFWFQRLHDNPCLFWHHCYIVTYNDPRASGRCLYVFRLLFLFDFHRAWLHTIGFTLPVAKTFSSLKLIMSVSIDFDSQVI